MNDIKKQLSDFDADTLILFDGNGNETIASRSVKENESRFAWRYWRHRFPVKYNTSLRSIDFWSPIHYRESDIYVWARAVTAEFIELLYIIAESINDPPPLSSRGRTSVFKGDRSNFSIHLHEGAEKSFPI